MLVYLIILINYHSAFTKFVLCHIQNQFTLSLKKVSKLCPTRNSGHYAPLFLAPAVGWEPIGLPAVGPSSPSR